MRNVNDKLARAALLKVPMNCNKLDNRDPITQFAAVQTNLVRIQMRINKTVDTFQLGVLRDIEAKAVHNLQRLSVEVSKYQSGAQALADRYQRG